MNERKTFERKTSAAETSHASSKRAAVKRRSVETAVRAACEPLERRLMLSKATVVDAGDERWISDLGQFEHLLRATDLVLVGFEPSGAPRVHRLSAALTAKTGALAGYEVLQAFDVTSVLFRRTAPGFSPSLNSLLKKVDSFPGVKHLSPTFFNVPDHLRIVIFDSIYVNFADTFDSTPVFEKGFATVTPAGQNAFYATLRRGGALDALRVAEKLRHESYVEGDDVNTASQIQLSAAPNDAHYINGDQWGTEKGTEKGERKRGQDSFP